MLKLLHHIRNCFAGGLPLPTSTVIEYEAVCLIAYEGRAAYQRAREQAEYCSQPRERRQAAGSGQR